MDVTMNMTVHAMVSIAFLSVWLPHWEGEEGIYYDYGRSGCDLGKGRSTSHCKRGSSGLTDRLSYKKQGERGGVGGGGSLVPSPLPQSEKRGPGTHGVRMRVISSVLGGIVNLMVICRRLIKYVY